MPSVFHLRFLILRALLTGDTVPPETYKLQVKAMGGGQVKIIPDLIINGSNKGSTHSGLSDLLGLKPLEVNGEQKVGQTSD